jgi:hypothetical protein
MRTLGFYSMQQKKRVNAHPCCLAGQLPCGITVHVGDTQNTLNLCAKLSELAMVRSSEVELLPSKICLYYVPMME